MPCTPDQSAMSNLVSTVPSLAAHPEQAETRKSRALVSNSRSRAERCHRPPQAPESPAPGTAEVRVAAATAPGRAGRGPGHKRPSSGPRPAARRRARAGRAGVGPRGRQLHAGGRQGPVGLHLGARRRASARSGSSVRSGRRPHQLRAGGMPLSPPPPRRESRRSSCCRPRVEHALAEAPEELAPKLAARALCPLTPRSRGSRRPRRQRGSRRRRRESFREEHPSHSRRFPLPAIGPRSPGAGPLVSRPGLLVWRPHCARRGAPGPGPARSASGQGGFASGTPSRPDAGAAPTHAPRRAAARGVRGCHPRLAQDGVAGPRARLPGPDGVADLRSSFPGPAGSRVAGSRASGRPAPPPAARRLSRRSRLPSWPEGLQEAEPRPSAGGCERPPPYSADRRTCQLMGLVRRRRPARPGFGPFFAGPDGALGRRREARPGRTRACAERPGRDASGPGHTRRFEKGPPKGRLTWEAGPSPARPMRPRRLRLREARPRPCSAATGNRIAAGDAESVIASTQCRRGPPSRGCSEAGRGICRRPRPPALDPTHPRGWAVPEPRRWPGAGRARVQAGAHQCAVVQPGARRCVCTPRCPRGRARLCGPAGRVYGTVGNTCRPLAARARTCAAARRTRTRASTAGGALIAERARSLGVAASCVAAAAAPGLAGTARRRGAPASQALLDGADAVLELLSLYPSRRI